MELPESIIKRLQQGEKELFGQLIEVYQDRVYGLLMKLMQNEEDANEIAQIVFIQVYQKIKTFRGVSKLSVWIYRITYNHAMTQLKSNKRWVYDYFEDEDTERTYEPEILKQLNQKDEQEKIQRALSQLSPSEQMLLNLFYLEELSYDEIVNITKLSLSNVKVKLHRSKKKLKNLLMRTEIYQNV